MADVIYCSVFKIPLIEECLTMAEWSATWQSFGIAITLAVGIATVAKIWCDINSSKLQKNGAEKLERTKFFLEQHRRLFDDEDLKSVLQHLDGDDVELAHYSFWERNRKFLVFIEEVQLLINSELLDEKTCQYMFGYYASCAYMGDNFKSGIAFEEQHWGLFSVFAKNYEKYKDLFNPEYIRDIKA